MTRAAIYTNPHDEHQKRPARDLRVASSLIMTKKTCNSVAARKRLSVFTLSAKAGAASSSVQAGEAMGKKEPTHTATSSSATRKIRKKV